MIDNAKNVPVITIDGPSGTGKGTICHLVAAHLGWHFLDSGAIYRVLAFAARHNNVPFSDTDALVALALSMKLHFEVGASNNILVFLDAQEISADIRAESCGQDASKIAVISVVREALLARQRAFAISPGLVTDGRDMGTVVFPDAFLKIYLYASAEARAMRRYLQLKSSGNNASLADVLEELTKRDVRDASRAHSPLRAADDAHAIDTTGLTIEEVFEKVVLLLRGKGIPSIG